MKDRHAVTRQWLSLPPPVTPEAAHALALDDIAILEVARHPHKLRTGHVRANRFVLRVRGVADAMPPRARARSSTRSPTPPGAPNWYGEQRFGRDGDNAATRPRDRAAASEPPRDRKLARLLVSSLQSRAVQRLARRAASPTGSTRACSPATCCTSVGGGMFTCEDPATDEARLLAGELVVTGPMFGDRDARAPTGSAGASARPRSSTPRASTRDSFASVRAIAEGTRRDATIAGRRADRGPPIDGDAIEVAFTLPGGAYATAVMRELMKIERGSASFRRDGSVRAISSRSPSSARAGCCGC